MRVAIDYTAALEQGGGIGRYVRELVRALAETDDQNEYRLFAAGRRAADLPRLPGPDFTWKPSPVTPAWYARLWHRARLPVPVELWTGVVDLFHATDFTLPPTLPAAHTILTVHDLSFIRTPETADPGLRAYLNQVVPRSIKRADLVLADSKATRQDILDLYGTAPDKVKVLYAGVDEHFRPVSDQHKLGQVRQKYNIGVGPYILSVGTVQPRKNYGRLAEAFARLNRPDLKLVIAGGKGWLDDDLYGQIESLELDKRVIFTGFVADEDLPALYTGADIFAFPSLYEGFGLPPLEAMACGTPVVASNVSSLPEVVGDAGLSVDPYDIPGLTAALARLLDDPSLRSELIQRGHEQVNNFEWIEAARQLKDHYHEVLS